MALTSLGGYVGRILRVDLTNGKITEENLPEETLRKYVGGVGLGANCLYHEVPPGVEWNEPENRLILAAGPLNGTRVAGSGTFCVVTKGPLTNGAASSQANGYFGAFLKFSGFDAIIVQGKAKEWVYLYLHDGLAELRDASHLVGKDTWETEDLIKAELKKRERELSVFGIGPAGENLVKFAAIVGDRGHVAGHNGVGAVMGSKKLKAVAVERGKFPVTVKNQTRLSAVARWMTEEYKKSDNYIWGTSRLYGPYAISGLLPVKNLTTSLFPEYARFMGESYRSRFECKPSPCWACSAKHCHLIKVSEGPYAGYTGEEPEYEAWAAWSSLIGQDDVGAAFMLNDVCDRLGFEANEAGWLVAMVMECYERGIIGREETDGLEMRWGNAEATRELLHKIARRQGFGNVLAEGVMRAAQAIGRGAPDIGVYLKKGNAPRGHDHRVRWNEILDVATSNTGTVETGGVRLTNPFSPEEVSMAVVKEKGPRIFVDSLVMCFASTMTMGSTKIDHLVEMLQATTGWDFTLEEAKKAGLRIVNLLRAFNIRHGITPEVEAPSPRYSSAPVDGPAKGVSIAPHWEEMLSNYYKLMGWDRKSGKPLPETLKKLGLEQAAQELWP